MFDAYFGLKLLVAIRKYHYQKCDPLKWYFILSLYMLCYIIIKKNIKNERIVNGISYKEDKEWSGERRGEGGGEER